MRAYDKSVRWLIQNCAEALLQVVRGRRVLHWETISPSLLHLERTPDGLLGVLFDGETELEQVLLEITT